MGDRYILKNNTIVNTKVPFFIYVDTRNRFSGSRTNFQFRVRNLEKFQKLYCCIANYEFSHIYQVDSSNNKFVINDGSRKVLTLDLGSYNTSQFCTELQSKLSTATPTTTWTVQYDDESDLISLKENGAPTVSLLFSDSEFTSKSFLRESSNVDFTLINDTFYTFSERYTSIPTSYLLLQCNNLMLNPSVFTDNVGGSQILQRLIVPPKYTINYYSENHISYVLKEIDISSGILNFRLIRPDGSDYNETNIKDYSFVLVCYPCE